MFYRIIWGIIDVFGNTTCFPIWQILPSPGKTRQEIPPREYLPSLDMLAWKVVSIQCCVKMRSRLKDQHMAEKVFTGKWNLNVLVLRIGRTFTGLSSNIKMQFQKRDLLINSDLVWNNLVAEFIQHLTKLNGAVFKSWKRSKKFYLFHTKLTDVWIKKLTVYKGKEGTFITCSTTLWFFIIALQWNTMDESK